LDTIPPTAFSSIATAGIGAHLSPELGGDIADRLDHVVDVVIRHGGIRRESDQSLVFAVRHREILWAERVLVAVIGVR